VGRPAQQLGGIGPRALGQTDGQDPEASWRHGLIGMDPLAFNLQAEEGPLAHSVTDVISSAPGRGPASRWPPAPPQDAGHAQVRNAVDVLPRTIALADLIPDVQSLEAPAAAVTTGPAAAVTTGPAAAVTTRRPGPEAEGPFMGNVDGKL
jgi:hypothetical protein